jgi:hypothetical protein
MNDDDWVDVDSAAEDRSQDDPSESRLLIPSQKAKPAADLPMAQISITKHGMQKEIVITKVEKEKLIHE